MVIEDTRRDGELGLRAHIADTLRTVLRQLNGKLAKSNAYLAEHPSVDEQACAVSLGRALFKLETQERVCVLREVKIDGSDEEADARGTVGKTVGELARCPGGRVEAGQVPALAFSEKPALVHQPANLVGVAMPA